MAKVSSIQKNINRRELVKKFKNKRLLLKNKIKQKDLSIEERLVLQKKLIVWIILISKYPIHIY